MFLLILKSIIITIIIYSSNNNLISWTLSRLNKVFCKKRIIPIFPSRIIILIIIIKIANKYFRIQLIIIVIFRI